MADQAQQQDDGEYYEEEYIREEYNIPYDDSMAQYYQQYYQIDDEPSVNPVAASAAPAIFESAEVFTANETGHNPDQIEEIVTDSNAVPYPEGYIPSVTTVFLKKQEETTHDAHDPSLIGNPYAKNYQDPYLKRKETDSDQAGIPEARKRIFRAAAGELWEDTNLYEWDPGKIIYLYF
jgi:hypothetical protein